MNRIGNEEPLQDSKRSVAFVWCVPLAFADGAEQEVSGLLNPIEAARAARSATRNERRCYTFRMARFA